MRGQRTRGFSVVAANAAATRQTKTTQQRMLQSLQRNLIMRLMQLSKMNNVHLYKDGIQSLKQTVFKAKQVQSISVESLQLHPVRS
jgi:acetolactate synthase regulatory subunit